MKLRPKMIIRIGVPALLIVFVLSLIAYLFSSALLTGESKEILGNMAEKYARQVESYLEKQVVLVEGLALSMTKVERSAEELQAELSHLAANNSDISDIYVGFPDKSFVTASNWDAPSDYDPTSRPWYTKAADSQGEAVITDIYTDSITGKMVLTVAAPIRQNNRLAGVVGMDVFVDSVAQMVNEIKAYTTGKAFVLNSAGNFVAHKEYGLEDNVLEISNGIYQEVGRQILAHEEHFFRADKAGVSTFFDVSEIAHTDWVLVMDVPVAEVLEPSRTLAVFMSIVGFVSIAILLGQVLFTAHSIAKPIDELSHDLENLAKYQLALADDAPCIRYGNAGGEIGLMAKSLEKVIRVMRLLIERVNNMSTNIHDTSTGLADSSATSSDATQEISTSIAALAEAVSDQTAQMQKATTIAESMEKLLETNSQAQESLAEAAGGVIRAKETGVEAIAQLISTTQLVSGSAEKVNRVISDSNASAIQIENASNMIKAIASQTNLLALNAAIEAARAGETGKGFAVVADEIRTLAEQSNKFAEEIAAIVAGLTHNTNEAVSIMSSVLDTVKLQSGKVNETKVQFDAISDEIKVANAAVQNLSSIQEELGKVKNRFFKIIKDLTILAEENTASTEECSAAVEEQVAISETIEATSGHLATASKDLAYMIRKFHL